MPTINIGKPGIFDQYANTLNTEELQRRHGIDPSMNSASYSDIAGQNRNVGLAGQADAMAMYRQGAMGKGPSVAGAMWQQQNQRNMTDALALQARGRGGNIAGMGQQALASNVYANQQTNQGMAALRAQEQQAAMAGYAGMANQVSGQGLGYDQLASQTAANAANNTLGWYTGERSLDLQSQQQSHQRTMDWMNQGREWGQAIAGGVSGGMGAGLQGTSDERAKENIQPTTLAASQAIGGITPAVFNYKPGMGPGGERIGIMAQDLERSPYTASLVQEGPDGVKRVDGYGLAAFATATGAEHEGRLRALEQQQGMGSLRAVPPTQPRQSSMYQPDQDIDFGTRVSMARANGPWNIPQKSTRTIDPFDSDTKTLGGQMISDERAKQNVRQTVSTRVGGSERKTHVDPGIYGGGQPRPGLDVRARVADSQYMDALYRPPERAITAQEQVDADNAQDIVDRLTDVDEAGVRRLAASPRSETSSLFYPRGERRYDKEQAAQSMAAVAQERARLEAQAAAIRKQYGLDPRRTV